MGVVNVTPDSFSDGGDFLDAHAAVAHALELVEQGADILDVGGESTRPGAEPVALAEELRRVVPVLEGIAAAAGPGGRTARVSIDTVKAPVAAAAIEAGASIVNDVSALRADPAMAGLVAERGVECCLMHMLGEPRTMQREGAGGPRYGDVVDDVKAFLEERLAFAVDAGVAEEKVMLDPGIGFGKTVAHNLALLDRLDELVALGRPVAIGTSRKSFIGRLLADAAGRPQPAPVGERLAGTIATNVLALERGASVFRVHDVAPVRDALEIAAATLSARWTASPPRSPRS
ncbi:MAG TPA: dihydropteroate synthase [Solirubrobacteraceae bacterium]|nr:dihydropteroate synthase [Solirubrobacteraceae bacterium]